MIKKVLLLTSILFELIISGYLIKQIYEKQKNVLGIMSINPLKKEDYIFGKGSGLKYFYEPKPNSIGHPFWWLTFKAAYTINSDSLNSLKEYNPEKPLNTFRIIALGDSFTFGENVDTKDNWTSKLESLLNTNLKCNNFNNYEVINLGVGGYDFEYAVERYRIRGIKYHPDLVFWLITDFQRIYEKIAPLNDKYFKAFNQSGELQKQVMEGKPYESFRLAREQVVSEIGEQGLEQYQINAISKLNNDYTGKLVFLTFSNFGSEYLSVLSDISKKRENTLIFSNISDINKIDGATLSDSHPSPRGHTIIAQDIYNYLIGNKLIPCK